MSSRPPAPPPLPAAEAGPVTPDLAAVDRLVEEIGRSPDALIPLLQGLQEHYRYLPPEALRRLCELSEITPAQLTGVASFYPHFRHRPAGEHVVRVCHGTACHVKGAELISAALERHLGLEAGQDTDAEGRFTLERVACLGCCTLAPVMQVDSVTYGHLTPDSVPQALRDFLEMQRRGLGGPALADGRPAAPALGEIRVGLGSCCVAGGSDQVRDALEQALRESGAPVAIKPVGCVGMCHQTPLVQVLVPGREPVVYAKLQAEDAAAVVRRHFRPPGPLRRAKLALTASLERLLTDEAWEPVTRYGLDARDPPVCAFLGRQRHLATEGYGDLDPLDLDEYLAAGGFEALRQCREGRSPEEVIEALRASGLRGRGGAGFPTGEKWAAVRAAPGERKYVICNGDEGDPGAFMDRMLLESYPYRILEGLAIAAYAVGAAEAIFYIRAEYPLAVQRIWQALERAEQAGLLGDAASGGVQIGLMEGAGAFVCGEESALLASLEGRRGMPRLRPPYPAQEGLWGQPTLVNNVETLAMVPWILRHGPEAFRALGSATSAGTKVFALAGKVQRGGLIEVPMGITLREIVEEIGGGVPEGRRFKAVQIGGPSGGCVPAELADLPVDFEALTGAGAIMGSGGLVVVDDTDCMVDLARYFLEFTQRESCGKCAPCRIGTRRMLDILDRLCTGHGREGDLERLAELGERVKQTSLCGLGGTAPNPIQTTLTHFREEYEAHLAGRCPAGRCRGLITYRITEQCVGCTKCAQSCPAEAIALRPFERHEIDPERCIRCDSCRRVCTLQAVVVE